MFDISPDPSMSLVLFCPFPHCVGFFLSVIEGMKYYS